MSRHTLLIIGDILAIALLTVIGFATHDNITDVARMPTTFFPALLSWFLIAPLLGLYTPNINANPRQLWRPIYAAILAAPLMVILRALILNSVGIPLFAVVFAATSALGMFIWRGIWWAWQYRK